MKWLDESIETWKGIAIFIAIAVIAGTLAAIYFKC